MRLSEIVAALPHITNTTEHHTNLYLDSGCCALASESLSDGGALARQRLSNLDRHLRLRATAPIVLVGEAPGWRGARQTGIAFTAPYNLNGTGLREPSATVVQSTLASLGVGDQVLLWNACLLHPHQGGQPATNRPPSPAALDASADLLEAVTRDRFVVAVGNHAARAISAILNTPVVGLDELAGDPRAVHVRHPSYGGASEFRAGMARVIAAVQA